MLLSGGGPDFAYPQGDPGAVAGAAGGLERAASALDGAASRMSSAAGAVAASWSGPAFGAFEEAVGRTREGLQRLAGHHRDAATALKVYAAALTRAQAAAGKAAQGYAGAEEAYSATMNSLHSDPPTGKGASAAIDRITATADDHLEHAYAAATAAAAEAVHEAHQAAATCAARLSEISGALQDTALHKFLDMMGGPGTVFGALGITLQGKSALDFWKTLHAMDTGDFAGLEKSYPTQYAETVGKAVSAYGADSMQALKAQLAFEEKVANEAFGGLSDAASGLDAVPAGKVAGALDVLGKVGVVTAVAGDVMTFADGQAKPADKAVAGVNLAGIAMAATGNEVVGGAVGALIGADVATSWVPVVGEVLVAGTAVYMGEEWVRGHWSDIEHWASDVGSGLASGYHAVVHAGQWVDGKIAEGETAVTSGINDANRWAVSHVPGLGAAEHVASGLDPLEW